MRRSIVLVVATMLLAGCTLARGLTSTTCPSSRRLLPQAAADYMVRCKLADHIVEEPGGQLDGDAAYLDPGTAVYAVRGYRPSFRLAARREGKPVLFEAAENPRAGTRPDERRADLLPGGRDGDLPRLRPALPPARLPLPAGRGASDPRHRRRPCPSGPPRSGACRSARGGPHRSR
jgi:hypothetical protein